MRMQRTKGTRRAFRVMIAIDGSPSAEAALMTAAAFPWPPGSRVQAVMVSAPEWFGGSPQYVRIALARHFDRVVASTARRLRRYWPDATVVKVKARPVDGILREAERFRADVIVIGWRGHGTFRRLLVGSVSRRIVERAKCPVLVVRRRVREIRRVVIGADGSADARRAIDFLCGLDRDRRAAVTVVGVVEPIVLPTSGILPASIRSTLRHNAATMTKELISRARRDATAAAATLTRAGWRVRVEVRSGAALVELLAAAEQNRCDVLVVGARGTRGGLERALLGSVAAGVLNRSRRPVMVVR
jgi:nucleotide-binding universal stress UspA family protein